MTAGWPAISAARRFDAAARVPFTVAGRAVGSVARSHLPALRHWPKWLRVQADGVTLTAQDRDTALAAIHAALRAEGLILAWRDEIFPLFDPATLEPLARIERAASRFWGTLTLGAHANGFVADATGRPTHLWIARRSAHKATDPGLFDNLVGGGVPAGQSPFEALIREAWEEAGLTPAQMAHATPGRVIRLRREIAEGLQVEDLHGFDLALPAGCVPQNQDGEVERFDLLPVADALALAAGNSMTVDAALVTLDFGLRHGLLTAPPGADVLLSAI